MDIRYFAASVYVFFAGCAAGAAPLTTVAYMEPKPNIHPPESGFGFTVATADRGCAFLTTEHLVRKAETRQLFVRDAKRPIGYDHPLSEVDEIADVSISNSIDAQFFDGCPSVPTTARTNELLYSGQVEIVILLGNGSTKHIPMRITQHSSTEIVARTFYPDDQLASGMSGAPLVAAGEPVGMLTKVAGSSGSFVRLDALPVKITKLLGSATSVSGPAGPPPPLDVNRLPEDVRLAVLRAWEVKRFAETAAKLGRDEYDRAKEAAARADLIPQEGLIQNGFARYFTDGGGYYRGTAILKYSEQNKQQLLSPAGPGVLQVQSGIASGNVFACRIGANGSCNGHGVADYAGNKWNVSNVKRYEGGFQGGAMIGGGILQFYNGWTHFAEFRTAKDNTLDFGSYGANISPDGVNFYEGLHHVNPNGGTSGSIVLGLQRWKQNGLDYYCIWDTRAHSLKQKSSKIDGFPYCQARP
jgi:hypothetical protein